MYIVWLDLEQGAMITLNQISFICYGKLTISPNKWPGLIPYWGGGQWRNYNVVGRPQFDVIRQKLNQGHVPHYLLPNHGNSMLERLKNISSSKENYINKEFSYKIYLIQKALL